MTFLAAGLLLAVVGIGVIVGAQIIGIVTNLAAARRPKYSGPSESDDPPAIAVSSARLPSSVAPLRVSSIDVHHYARLNENEVEPRGILGQESFSPRFRDLVTIEVRLTKPVYA